MKFFTRAATTALTGLAIFGFASAAFAETVLPPEGSPQAHVILAAVIEDAGVDFTVNHPYCQKEKGLNGFYSGRRKLLVVCNDNYSEENQNPEWTANDYDTLRHEAQHFIQDCAVGTNHDHWLNPLTDKPREFAEAVLGPKAVDAITRHYRKRGASNHILNLEYEAFAAARLNMPLKQADAIVRVCRLEEE